MWSPHIEVPTMVICGGNDTRAPRPVAEDLHASIPGSRLVACNIEAPEEFNDMLRGFLRDQDVNPSTRREPP